MNNVFPNQLPQKIWSKHLQRKKMKKDGIQFFARAPGLLIAQLVGIIHSGLQMSRW